MAGATGLNIAHWATGYGHNTDIHFLKLDFVDGKSVTVALQPAQADEIAQALLRQLCQKPPKPNLN
ncbi:hypothetical protein KUL72_15700 [Bradyrhizobium arachidis]|uniref:hypothetical protein n=1 Tax=Bradyrhizobium TaxID=374 RepID=UPI00188AE2CB|nr:MULTISPECIES: hypothetical protein [Bradyrhizobium]MDN4988464.1 hypothetical protein [Bradyrhizobium sp. WYCCWR 13022]QOZ52583.1 hypothetical protein XH90_15325 [Bradyrhizobium sp. CCBAU 53338]UVO39692.1 hypothetical protein KUL72_15700 [Bradyrhizobium arachidis]